MECSTSPMKNVYFRSQLNDNKKLPKNFASQNLVDINSIFNEHYYQIPEYQTHKVIDQFYGLGCQTNFQSGLKEIYLALGLTSCEDGKNYRNDLNLVLLLDMSQSMNEKLMVEKKMSKLQVLKNAVIQLIDSLRQNDYIGIIAFDHDIEIIQNLQKMSAIDKIKLKKSINNIKPRGSTNLDLAFKEAYQMISSTVAIDNFCKKNSSRMICFTDAMVNSNKEENILLNHIKNAATNNQIYTTIFGIGLNFSKQLVDTITNVRGANYFSLYSQKDFEAILLEQFNYIVTPIAFDFKITLASNKLQFQKQYAGFKSKSPEKNMIVQFIDTVLAGPKKQAQMQGGYFLFKFAINKHEKLNLDSGEFLNLQIQYEKCNGEKIETEININWLKKLQDLGITNFSPINLNFSELNPNEIYENYEMPALKKLILIANYIDFLETNLPYNGKLLNIDRTALRELIRKSQQQYEASNKKDEQVAQEIKLLNYIRQENDENEREQELYEYKYKNYEICGYSSKNQTTSTSDLQSIARSLKESCEKKNETLNNLEEKLITIELILNAILGQQLNISNYSHIFIDQNLLSQQVEIKECDIKFCNFIEFMEKLSQEIDKFSTKYIQKIYGIWIKSIDINQEILTIQIVNECFHATLNDILFGKEKYLLNVKQKFQLVRDIFNAIHLINQKQLFNKINFNYDSIIIRKVPFSIKFVNLSIQQILKQYDNNENQNQRDNQGDIEISDEQQILKQFLKLLLELFTEEKIEQAQDQEFKKIIQNYQDQIIPYEKNEEENQQILDKVSKIMKSYLGDEIQCFSQLQKFLLSK